MIEQSGCLPGTSILCITPWPLHLYPSVFIHVALKKSRHSSAIRTSNDAWADKGGAVRQLELVKTVEPLVISVEQVLDDSSITMYLSGLAWPSLDFYVSRNTRICCSIALPRVIWAVLSLRSSHLISNPFHLRILSLYSESILWNYPRGYGVKLLVCKA